MSVAASRPRPKTIGRPRLRLLGLLSLPGLWLAVAYLGSLAAMFATAFWTTDDFTGNIVRTFTTTNFSTLIHESVYWHIAVRSLGVATAVTIVDACVAFPIAF